MRKSTMVTLALFIALSFWTMNCSAADNINEGAKTRDVTKLANVSAIFGTKEAIINIDGASAAGDKWIQISNQGAASGNLTGWSLHNEENLTYTFPVYVLAAGSTVKVHGGNGVNTGEDLYANTTTPLVNDKIDVITLMDTSGATVVKYSFDASAPTTMTSTRSAEKQPILINDNSTKKPETAPLLVNTSA
jgi:hypothetical protein